MAEFRVDFHVKILDDEVVKRAKTQDLDALVYAPHFTRLPDIQRRAAQFSDDDLLVVPGREVFTGDWRNRKHILAIGLSDPIPDFITLEGAMAEFTRQNAAVLIPHPAFATVSMEAHDLRAHREQVHALEVYNPKHMAHHNDQARDLAMAFDLPSFGSSYAHLRRTVGEAWTTFSTHFETADELTTAVQDGVPREVYHQTGIGHQLRCAAEFGHLFYENSWQKIDRVFLSGTEPTHPDHIAYDGQFDHVSVYS